jgi:Icc-related predicted phosphoesterase
MCPRWASDLEAKESPATSAIPAGLHVLATHSPPRGAFDAFDGEHIGSTSLREAVERARPQLHYSEVARAGGTVGRGVLPRP